MTADKEELARNSNMETANEFQPEDLPQEITESYGTGVHPEPGYNVGEGTMPHELAEYTIPSKGLAAADEDAVWKEADELDDEVGDNPVLTAGDIDAAWDQADTVGDEAVGGTAPTPDQDIVDEIGAAVGLEIPDREYVHGSEILETRDDRRWELDPKSSEDYQDRREEQ
jgi:hypothetical protein